MKTTLEILKNAKAAAIELATLSADIKNAALLAIQMLAINDASLAEKLDAKRKAATETVLEKNKKIEEEFNK